MICSLVQSRLINFDQNKNRIQDQLSFCILTIDQSEIINIRGKFMQLVESNNTAVPKGDSVENFVRRDMLKLSDLDAELASDLSNMFGKWFEADHCDKDIS